MKIQIFFITFIICLLLLIPNVNASIQIVENGDDLFPNLLKLTYTNDSVNYEINYLEPNTNDSIIYYYGMSFYLMSTSYQVADDAVEYMDVATPPYYQLKYYTQYIDLIYPDGYTIKQSVNAWQSAVDSTNSSRYNYYMYYVFPPSAIINQTGNYTFSVVTTLIPTWGTVNIYYNNYTLEISELILPPDEDEDEDEDDYFTSLSTQTIGVIGGLISLIGIFFVPVICGYKIKQTNEKMKWIIYGFLTVCILGVIMVALFQLGT